jgi:hypothetical protein
MLSAGVKKKQGAGKKKRRRAPRPPPPRAPKKSEKAKKAPNKTRAKTHPLVILVAIASAWKNDVFDGSSDVGPEGIVTSLGATAPTRAAAPTLYRAISSLTLDRSLLVNTMPTLPTSCSYMGIQVSSPFSSQYSLMERFIMVFLPIRMTLSGRRPCWWSWVGGGGGGCGGLGWGSARRVAAAAKHPGGGGARGLCQPHGTYRADVGELLAADVVGVHQERAVMGGQELAHAAVVLCRVVFAA